MKKNTMIQIMRLVFCAAIVVFHSRNLYDYALWGELLLPTGYMAVEFFFLVSGYLLARNACREDEKNTDGLGAQTWRYLKKKFAPIVPYYISSFLFIYLCIIILSNGLSALQKGVMLLDAVPELLMIGASGLTTSYFNGATWFLSALLVSNLILYPICRKLKSTFTMIIAPVIAILISGLMNSILVNLAMDLYPMGLVRAIMEVCAGCGIYAVSQWLQKRKISGAQKTVLTLVETGSYLLAIILMTKVIGVNWNKSIFLLLTVAVTISFSETSWTSKLQPCRLTDLAGKISLIVYLNHEWIGYWIKDLLPNTGSGTRWLLYLAGIAVCSFACAKLGKLLGTGHQRSLDNTEQKPG